MINGVICLYNYCKPSAKKTMRKDVYDGKKERGQKNVEAPSPTLVHVVQPQNIRQQGHFSIEICF